MVTSNTPNVSANQPVLCRGFCATPYATRTVSIDGKKVRGVWVVGAYMVHLNRTPSPIGDHIRPEDIEHLIIFDGFSDWNMPREIEWKKVIPQTVGRLVAQIPGVGQLFEHDIVRYKDVHSCINQPSIGTVMLDHKTNTTLIQQDGRPPQPLLLNENTILEIVGNIFETDLAGGNAPN